MAERNLTELTDLLRHANWSEVVCAGCGKHLGWGLQEYMPDGFDCVACDECRAATPLPQPKHLEMPETVTIDLTKGLPSTTTTEFVQMMGSKQ